MSTTLDGSKLSQIKVVGKGLSGELVEQATKASFSTSTSSVTELSLTFLDSLDLQIFRSEILKAGATISYGGWNFRSRVLSLKSGSAGPELTVKAPSLYVEKLKTATGGHSWGFMDTTKWVEMIAREVGMDAVVQPGLGVLHFMREAPEGDKRESTWDVLVSAQKLVGTWLFEYGNTLVFARPSWLMKTGWVRNQWPLVWNDWNDLTDGLAGMPEYSVDEDKNPSETLKVELHSADADRARPGDQVSMSGRCVGDMKGDWIVTGVSYPMTVAGNVSLTCQRAVDPVIPPPAEKKSTAAASGGGGAVSGGGTGGASAALSGKVDAFVNRWLGRAIDFDGAYGAQCVDLANQYAREVAGVGLGGGNAKDLFGSTGPGWYKLSANQKANKGDLAIWDASWGGGYGHVALVLSDNGGNLSTLTQNPGAPNKANFGKNGLLGYLRPKI